MDNSYIALSDHYAIKGSVKEQVLQNLINGQQYELDIDQFELLQMFDGSRRFDDLLMEYDQNSYCTFIRFVDYLSHIGAVTYSNNKKLRALPSELVPDIRLQTVHLEPNSACNMQCKHCYQGDVYGKSKLSYEVLLNIADDFKLMQIDGLSFSGGEPFIHEHTIDYAKHLEKLKVRINSIFTNGLEVRSDLLVELNSLISKPTIFISLDSLTGEGMGFRGYTDCITGENAVSQIIYNIERIISTGLPVVINTVMNPLNIYHIHKIYDRVKSWDVYSWRLGFPKMTGRFEQNATLFNLSLEEYLEEALKLLLHHLDCDEPFHFQIEYLYRPELFKDFPVVTDVDYICDYEGRREGCCIKPNGDVVPCAYACEFPIGNINKNSLYDIWYSDKMQSIKNRKIGEVLDCMDCTLKAICATGCRANAFFLGGDFYNSKDGYACKAIQFFEEKLLPELADRNITT